jgi:hypothetical protein
MHVENELVGFVTAGGLEYEEIIKEYEEEILMPEKVSEPSLTDHTDTPPTQGKLRCITLILQITIYIFIVHLRCSNFMLRLIGSVGNLPLLTQ